MLNYLVVVTVNLLMQWFFFSLKLVSPVVHNIPQTAKIEYDLYASLIYQWSNLFTCLFVKVRLVFLVCIEKIILDEKCVTLSTFNILKGIIEFISVSSLIYIIIIKWIKWKWNCTNDFYVALVCLFLSYS